jgi:hypothetical protein
VIAAVKALPLVTPTSVREPNSSPPPVAVVGGGDAPVGQALVAEQLPGRERHAHDPAGRGAGPVDQGRRRQGERGDGQVPEGPLEGGRGHPAQRRHEPAHLGGHVRAGVHEEGDVDGGRDGLRSGHGCGQ